MDISESMVRYYLDYITVGWFDHNDLPPYNIEEYYDCVQQMRLHVAKHSDLHALRLAFEHLLGNPQIDCRTLGDGRYPYDDQEVREIIHYAWKTLWPDAPPVSPGGPSGVKLVQMSLDDWRESHKHRSNQ